MNGDGAATRLQTNVVGMHTAHVRDGILGSTQDESKLCLVGDGHTTYPVNRMHTSFDCADGRARCRDDRPHANGQRAARVMTFGR